MYLDQSSDTLCIKCANARNQYMQPYVSLVDEALCSVVFNLVTGQPARCEDLRRPGVAMSRCGEGGALFIPKHPGA